MINSIDALAALIRQPPILVSIAAVILLVCCALLVAVRRQQRRLATMKTQLDSLSQAIDRLEEAHHELLVRFMNLSRWSRLATKSSSPPSDALEEKMTSSIAPKQPEEKYKGTALYVVAPKTTPEHSSALRPCVGRHQKYESDCNIATDTSLLQQN
jgi:hypothetical protein